MNPTQISSVEVHATPAELMRDAALYLERHGWTQGDYYARRDVPTPPACAAGAIAMATYGEPVLEPYSTTRSGWRDFVRATEFLSDYLDTPDLAAALDPTWVGSELPWDRQSIADWNDVNGQTADAVIATLYAAADEWDSRHSGGAQ